MQQNRSLTMEKKKIDFTIPNLGEAKIPSPIAMSESHGDGYADYVSDDDKILYSIEAKAQGGTITCNGDDYLEVAGPRAKIYFNPAHVHAAICTCGGICPGIEQRHPRRGAVLLVPLRRTEDQRRTVRVPGPVGEQPLAVDHPGSGCGG
jgi:hypothetical protein